MLSDPNAVRMTNVDWLLERATREIWIVSSTEKNPEILRHIKLLEYDLENAFKHVIAINKNFSRDWDEPESDDEKL